MFVSLRVQRNLTGKWRSLTMESMLEPILGTIDTRVIWVFIAVMGICIILSIIKKAIKLTVVIGIIAAIAIFVAPMAEDFQSRYHFEMVDGAITMTINGEEVSVEKDICKEIELENKGAEGYELRAVTTDGTLDIMIPTFMRDGIKTFAERYGIPIEVRD